jgi:hypothetical protein
MENPTNQKAPIPKEPEPTQLTQPPLSGKLARLSSRFPRVFSNLSRDEKQRARQVIDAFRIAIYDAHLRGHGIDTPFQLCEKPTCRLWRADLAEQEGRL